MDATVTIKTIAEKCGVAKSTVSRVLNNSGYVGKETREKIENIMREYNYSPSAMARNLSKQESNAVGVVIPEQITPSLVKCCGELVMLLMKTT